MTNTYTGSCACAAIQISLSSDPSFVGLCHCNNCRKSTGSTYSTNWIIPRASFTLSRGSPATYRVTGGSGAIVLRRFCATCGSSLWTEMESNGGGDFVVVKAGVLEEGAVARFKPHTESFVSRRPGWVGEVDCATQFQEAYQAAKTV